MNDMPVPEGDFFEQHRAKNRTYNAVLAAGIVIFGITFTIVSFPLCPLLLDRID